MTDLESIEQERKHADRIEDRLVWASLIVILGIFTILIIWIYA